MAPRLRHVLACASLLSLLVPSLASAQKLRVLVHNSVFSRNSLLAPFEARAGATLSVIKGGAQREAAARFIDFMRSPAVQTSMWMFPAEPGMARAEAMRHAVEPASSDSLSSEVIAEKDADWGSRWTRVALKQAV